jgi:hypothetical protein
LAHPIDPHLGTLEANRVHDPTLEPFVADRIAAGVTATTINRSLEVVRTMLNRAARSYRENEGRPWLYPLPPLITILSYRRERVLSRNSNNSLRSFAVVEVECPAESRVAIDSAISWSIDRGRVDQSIFDTRVVAFW